MSSRKPNSVRFRPTDTHGVFAGYRSSLRIRSSLYRIYALRDSPIALGTRTRIGEFSGISRTKNEMCVTRLSDVWVGAPEKAERRVFVSANGNRNSHLRGREKVITQSAATLSKRVPDKRGGGRGEGGSWFGSASPASHVMQYTRVYEMYATFGARAYNWVVSSYANFRAPVTRFAAGVSWRVRRPHTHARILNPAKNFDRCVFYRSINDCQRIRSPMVGRRVTRIKSERMCVQRRRSEEWVDLRLETINKKKQKIV